MGGSITDVQGIEVGHAQDLEGGTGCTVIICRKGAVTGVDAAGGAPGTRETDALRPENVIPVAHAIFLTGGSAFGLDCGTGVMKYL
jgi:L-aminopeptidase/D-esterase-like protein